MQSLAEIEKKKVAIQKAYLISCVNSRLEDLAAAAKVLKGQKVASGVKFYLSAASKWVQEEAEKRGIWQTLLDAGAQPLPSGCGPCIGLGVGLLEAGEVGISATNRNFKGRMGSRDAKCYLASPEVVAASAVAGYIRGPHEFANRAPQRAYTELASASGGAEKVEILAGFPQRVKGRLVFMPQDNVNTDAIYGKDYTYRDDMTPEMMAKVVMENYDPQFAARTQGGRCDRQPVQLWHRVEPRTGGHVSEGERHSAGDRGQLLADLSAECVQQWILVHRSAGICGACARAVCEGDRGESRRQSFPATKSILISLRVRSVGAERHLHFRRWAAFRSRW